MGFSVEYCPTGQMVADFFTKPLQGSLFRRMRDVVHGIQPRSTLNVGKTVDELNDVERKIDGKKQVVKAVRFKIESNNKMNVPDSQSKERVGNNKSSKRINKNDGCVAESEIEDNERRTYASVLRNNNCTKERKCDIVINTSHFNLKVFYIKHHIAFVEKRTY